MRGNEGGTLASASRTRKPDRSAGRKPPVVGRECLASADADSTLRLSLSREADVLEPGES